MPRFRPLVHGIRLHGNSVPRLGILWLNARTFALLNMTLSDAAAAVFDAKYTYNTWRPETAIRLAHTDGNDRTEPDAAFTPLITSPCFPSYPSAHATLSGGAREVLEDLFTARRRGRWSFLIRRFRGSSLITGS